jgi:hypothetical protein
MASRKEVLEMLSEGKIDVERATEMLNAAPAASKPPEPPPVPVVPPTTEKPADGKTQPRWLRIQVSDLETGKNRVRVNVPLGLVNFGLKVGARFTNEVDDDMMRDIIDALQSNEIVGTLVEVEDMDDNERVHIYVD